MTTTKTKEKRPVSELIEEAIGRAFDKRFGGLSAEQFAELTERVEAIEKRRQAMSLAGSGDTVDGGDGKDSYSLARVYDGLVRCNGNIDMMEKHAPLEYSMHAELADREYAQGTVPDTAGGFLVPAEVHMEMLVPLLRPRVISFDLGVTEVSFQTTPVEIPLETQLPEVTEVAENQGSDDTSVAFGLLRMEPHTAQSYIVGSKRFFTMGVGAETLIRRRMAKELALTYDRWILKGTGTNGQPIGAYNASGISHVDFSTVMATGDQSSRTIPTFELYERLLEMEDALADLDALDGAGKMGWAMANRALRALRLMRGASETINTGDATGEFANIQMQRKVFDAGAEKNILTYPFRRTTLLTQGADTEFLLADWETIIFGTWGGIVLEASGVAEDAMRKRQMHIVAHTSADVGVTRPESIAVADDFDTSSL